LAKISACYKALERFHPLAIPKLMSALERAVRQHDADVRKANGLPPPPENIPSGIINTRPGEQLEWAPTLAAMAEPRTPSLVTAFIEAFKRRHADLFLEAVADVRGEVSFECDGYIVTAHYDHDAGLFFKLVASPQADPLPGEPGVTYIITPPLGETWR
jgi:hypothetical protein